jgi:hypothetical protein
LEKPLCKRPIEQGEILASVAQKRMQINKLMAMVDEGVGPMSAVTVIFLSIRLAFLLFTNYSVAQDMFSGKMPPVSNFVILFPRTVLEIAALVSLANAGQSLKNEVILSQEKCF